MARIEMEMDISTMEVSSAEIHSLLAAWHVGAISCDAMLDLFRRGDE